MVLTAALPELTVEAASKRGECSKGPTLRGGR